MYLKSFSILFCITFSSILVNSKKTKAQSVAKIPWAKEQPAWVFPIYFEEGGGQKDTFYLGYDREASYYNPNLESQFGEFPYKDTSGKFEVLSASGLNPQVSITSRITSTTGIIFKNGHFPLTIRWDPKYLYTDSLPGYKSEGKEPPVVLFLDCPAPCQQLKRLCPIDAQNMYLLSDTGTGINAANRVDSLFFEFDTTKCHIPLDAWSVRLKVFPWEWLTIGINDEMKNDLINIFPNPANSFLIISLEEPILSLYKKFHIKVFDLNGTVVIEELKLVQQTTEISLSNLDNGIYILEIKTPNNIGTIHKLFQKI